MIDTCHEGEMMVLQQKQLGGTSKRVSGAPRAKYFRGEGCCASLIFICFCALTSQVVPQTDTQLSGGGRQDDLPTAVVR